MVYFALQGHHGREIVQLTTKILKFLYNTQKRLYNTRKANPGICLALVVYLVFWL